MGGETEKISLVVENSIKVEIEKSRETGRIKDIEIYSELNNIRIKNYYNISSWSELLAFEKGLIGFLRCYNVKDVKDLVTKIHEELTKIIGNIEYIEVTIKYDRYTGDEVILEAIIEAYYKKHKVDNMIKIISLKLPILSQEIENVIKYTRPIPIEF